MGLIFKSDFHDEFGTWPLAYIPYGGADFGEIQAIGKAVGDGDDSAFYDAFATMAAHLAADAAIAFDKGHRSSARELFLRASCLYAASYHPIYGAPVDPRLKDAFRKQIDSFNKGLSLADPAIAPLRIPFEHVEMPAYLIPAEGHANAVRPLIIFTNGYDATVTDLYFASAVAASRRGYHALIFDGPGQGAMLYEEGVPLRPDWETVIKTVVDFAVTLPNIDTNRIALSGWSLGGYLALRAASGESRLSACIADPAFWGIGPSLRKMAIKAGVPAASLKRLGDVNALVLKMFEGMIAMNRKLRWSIVQRGFWAHGVDNLRDYLAAVDQFTLEGCVEQIRCPTLLTHAENDALGADAPSVFDALTCPKTLIKFTSADGAGMHCEMMNRSLLNRRTLDWLDEQFRVDNDSQFGTTEIATMMSGRLIAAARALTGIGLDDLSSVTKISAAELARMEASDAALLPADAMTETVRKALEHFGAVFIAESDGMGAGVRLKFSRLDTRQIGRLEGEGGAVGDDDVP